MHRVDFQDARLAVQHRIDAADQAVAAEDGEDVVPVLPLRFGHVHLQPVAVIPERFCAVAVVDEAIKRGQERDPLANWAVLGVGVRVPLAFLVSDAERAPALLLQLSSGFGPGDALCFRIPAFGEVPESLLALAAGDGDDAAAFEQLEHQAHLAAPPPVVRVTGHHQVGLDLARGQWPTRFELAQQVSLEARVRPQEFGSLLLELCTFPAAGACARG